MKGSFIGALNQLHVSHEQLSNETRMEPPYFQ